MMKISLIIFLLIIPQCLQITHEAFTDELLETTFMQSHGNRGIYRILSVRTMRGLQAKSFCHWHQYNGIQWNILLCDDASCCTLHILENSLLCLGRRLTQYVLFSVMEFYQHQFCSVQYPKLNNVTMEHSVQDLNSRLE